MKKQIIYLTLLLSTMLVSCGSNKTKKTTNKEPQNLITVNIPNFNADSAYQYIAEQVEFGPRVPNTKAHQACADYLIKKLEQFGAKVYRQDFDAIAFDNTILKASNIIGAFNPNSKKRIALFAHWDSRPWADNDRDQKLINTPILGANDGASGVGVLLEIARNIQIEEPTLGIDIIFFDAEDYGTPQHYEAPSREEYWCLGSQYWSRKHHIDSYNARFGILLDMVGEKGATFFYEGYSKQFANQLLKKVWNQAAALGYHQYFIKRDGGAVIDDHLFVNTIANIKTIDIIPYYPRNKDSSFGSYWHTVKDDMDIIDKATLKAVGQTVTAVIYKEY